MNNYEYPFRNPDLPVEERVKDLVSRLTLDEKLGLLPTRQGAIERLGIKQWNVGTECARGFIGYDVFHSTCTPQPIGMASMFDPEIMYKLGEITGLEARVCNKKSPGKLMLWGPTVDMCRNPLWGRNEEAYGEDPVLTGEMSTAYTLGIRGKDPFYYCAMPALKHFVANNNEEKRSSCSANLEPRLKHEYYYAAFRPAIESGGAYSIMTSYNEINGCPAICMPDLQRVVKDKWGLGFIVTDGGDFIDTVNSHKYTSSAAETAAVCLKAGNDVMNDSVDQTVFGTRFAIESGWLTEADVDRAVSCVLDGRFRLGEFDPDDRNPYSNIPESIVNNEEFRAVNLRAAQESITLLKNDGLLPLEKGKKVAVIGPIGDRCYKDWYVGGSDYEYTVFDGMKKLLGEENVTFEDGYDRIALRSKANGKYITVDDSGSLFANSEEICGKAGFIKEDWGSGCNLLRSDATKKYLTESGEIKATADSAYAWFVTSMCHPFSYDGYMGIENWNHKSEWQIDEKGKLVALPHSRVKDCQLFTQEVISNGIERAVKAAKEADYAIVCVGNDPMVIAREGVDRDTLALPEYHSALIKAVREANPNTVVVVIASYPYSICEEKRDCPAIIYSSHAGPELGTSLASVIFGDYNPAGRCPQTWYKTERELPSIFDYDIESSKTTYLYYDGEPLFEFGYGLSYSTFEYSDMTAETVGDKIKLTVKVRNTSEIDGDEVVQAYYRMEKSFISRPLRKLIAFKRVHIKAGETAAVELSFDKSRLEFYNVRIEDFNVESGDYTFMIGASSLDIRLEKTLFVEGDEILPRSIENKTLAFNYDTMSQIRTSFSKLENEHYICAGGYNPTAEYRAFDLTGVKSVTVETSLSSGNARPVTLRIDGKWGEVIATVPTAPTPGKDEFMAFTAELSKPIEGVHDVWVSFNEGVNLMSIKFNK